MEEKIEFSILIKQLNKKTRQLIEENLEDIIDIGYCNWNIILIVYDMKKGLIFNHPKELAKFCIGYSEGIKNTITVTQDGKSYYNIFKKIAEELGYDIIYKEWID